jgi:hypothetical protein
MRQTFSALLVVGIFAFSLAFTVAAQDSDGTAVSEQTREQAKIMVTSHGAKVRLLQLEYSLQRQIRIGERIIQKASEIDESFDDTELEVILEEMKELKSRAGSADPGNSTNDVVREFVDLKHDAVQLSQQFRNITRNSFTVEERNQIKEGLMSGIEAEMSQERERIRNAIREHNEERIQNALRSMKSSDSGNLTQKAKSGEFDKEQIMEQIRDRIKEMTPAQKAEAAQEMRRIAEQKTQRARSAIDAAQERFQERLSERVQERLEGIQQSMGLTQGYIANRINQTLQASSGQGSVATGGDGQ